MQVQFVERNGGPERLICEAELVFDEGGPLAGMKLVGFSLWRGPEGAIYVTFPSRAFGAGTERRFFDFLRPADPALDARGDSRRVKSWILEQFQERRAS